MWILGLEAGAALFMLVFIVWWTMYAGRKPEQSIRPRRPADDAAPAERAPGPSGENDTPGA